MAAYDITADRAACEELIRAQIDQVLRLAVPTQQRSLPTEVTDRLDAAVRRIADAWAADTDTDNAYEYGANAYGPGPAFPDGD